MAIQNSAHGHSNQEEEVPLALHIHKCDFQVKSFTLMKVVTARNEVTAR